MKLYLDDIRYAPEGWVLARSVTEAKRFLLTGDIEAISLDHDMGICKACENRPQGLGSFRHCSHIEDGYALVLWMIKEDLVPPIVLVHSMNPVGKQRMLAALARRDSQ